MDGGGLWREGEEEGDVFVEGLEGGWDFGHDGFFFYGITVDERGEEGGNGDNKG